MVPETEAAPGEDAANIDEKITKDLKYYVICIDKVVVGSEKIDSNFERIPTLDNMPPKSIACYRETVHETESTDMANYIVVSFQERATTTSTFSNHHLDQSTAIGREARPSASRKIIAR